MRVFLRSIVPWTTAATAFLNPARVLAGSRMNNSIGFGETDFSSCVGSNFTRFANAATTKMLSVLNDVVPSHRSQLYAKLPEVSSELILDYFRRFQEEARDKLIKSPEDLGRKLENFQASFWDHAGPKADGARAWIRNNPRKAAAIAGSIVAPPVAAAAVFPAIAGVGFTAGGVAAGSVAASVHSAIGNAGAGSLFAILQSAGAGGAGATTIGSSVWGGTTLACWGATVASFLRDSIHQNMKEIDEEKGDSEPNERQSKL